MSGRRSGRDRNRSRSSSHRSRSHSRRCRRRRVNTAEHGIRRRRSPSSDASKYIEGHRDVRMRTSYFYRYDASQREQAEGDTPKGPVATHRGRHERRGGVRGRGRGEGGRGDGGERPRGQGRDGDRGTIIKIN